MRLRLFPIVNAVFFTILGVIMVYPFWHVLVGSFLPYQIYISSPIHIIPRGFTLDAYRMVFTENDILGAIQVTVTITIIGTCLSLIVTGITAYVLSKSYVRGVPTLRILFLFTMLFSGGIIPLYFCVRDLKMLNSIWALMLPQLINTYYLLIMRSFFVQFPRSLEEAAMIEGCREMGIFFRIVLPLSKPVLATIALFYAVDRWNEYFAAMMFSTNNNIQTLQLMLYRMITPGQSMSMSNAAYISASQVVLDTVKMAAVVIAAFPIVVVYPFLQKYFSKGVMLGAVKG